MQIFKNKKGVTLIEIVATITITSIALLLIYNILNYNVRQNAINRERTVNVNIANGIYNYLDSIDYTQLHDLLGENKSFLLSVENCKTDYSHLFSCDIFEPTINNKKYSQDNLYVYLFPYYSPNVFSYIKTKNLNEILDYYDNINPSEYPSNQDVLTVIVVVKSAIHPRYDVILRGVVTR